MKRYFIRYVLFLLSLGVLFPAAIQGQQQLKKSRRAPFCGFSLKDGYFGAGRTKAKQFITREAHIGDDSGIPEVVQAVKKQIGFTGDISVYIASKEDNCFATILDGRRVLIADHLFLNKVDKDAATQWAAISIISHEIGHHIAGFGRHESPLDDELDADYWSGFALMKLGASKSAAIKCIMVYGSEEDSESHPNKYKRSKMIEKGWEDASNGTIDYSKCGDCKE